VTYEYNCITVSVSMPDDLVTNVKDFVGAELFDKYIATAVEQRLRLDLLDDLSAELETEFGPISADVRKRTANTWPA